MSIPQTIRPKLVVGSFDCQLLKVRDGYVLVGYDRDRSGAPMKPTHVEVVSGFVAEFIRACPDDWGE